MASIVIKDLSESIDLDRQAMTAITGGARVRGRTILRSTRIIQYPPGFDRTARVDAAQRVPGNTPRK